MEGITGYIYRNAHHKYFRGIDKYFTPFVTPNQNKSFTNRELRDVLPENNEGINVVPQILSNKATEFIKAAQELSQMGYSEVNLNLGCPSGTVVSKYKGSGFLSVPDKLEEFLDKVCSADIPKISVKTRIGRFDVGEFDELLNIFNKFSIKELIIHPRIQTDFYNNKPNMKIFAQAQEKSVNPICYNGDIFTQDDYRTCINILHNNENIMLGRGMLMNPGFFEENVDKYKIREFLEQILSDYIITFGDDKSVLFKMKEIWFYMIKLFENEPDYSDTLVKKIRKASTIMDYQSAVESVFRL